MENKTNNRFVTTSSGARSWFLTVCSRRIQSDTRTSTQRQKTIYLLPLWGVNKDQVKTGSSKPPGGLPQVSMQHLAWRSHRWLPTHIAHLPLCMCASGSPGRPQVQWRSRRGGGWQCKASSLLLWHGQKQQNSPQMVWHGRRPKSWHRVLEAPVGPTSQSLDCWIFLKCWDRGHLWVAGKYQSMWKYHWSLLFVDPVFAYSLKFL